MDTTKEALQYVVALGEPIIKEINGLSYSDKQLRLIDPPRASVLKVSTLNAITDLIKNKFEGMTEDSIIIQVADELNVNVMSITSDSSKNRTHYVHAIAEDCPFRFGQFMPPEAFVIALQSMFLPDVGDIVSVLGMCSKLSTEKVATAEDDGISQVATTRKSAAFVRQDKVKARVQLAPYRTFREVEQPISDFLFRLRSDEEGQPPNCALFEADGGKWKITAASSVAAWLSMNTDKVIVVS